MKRKILLGLACLSLFAGVSFAEMYRCRTACGKVVCFYSADMSEDEMDEYAKDLNDVFCNGKQGVVIVRQI